MLDFLGEPIGVAAAGLGAALAYAIAILQWKRRLPERWEELTFAAIALLGGELVAGRIGGYSWGHLLLLPVALTAMALIAGKGSVAVFYTQREGEVASDATARARSRLTWLLGSVFVVGSVAVLVTG